ncbi:MAG: DUF2130 domain-containing protein [Candidatus Omnitrophica bacterium]|nr:DUF2130 domain-containing protein [Candidatus Omnitrophota bacterium]
MEKTQVKCPECGKKFELEDAFKRDMESGFRAKLEAETKKKDAEWQKRLDAREEELQKENTEFRAKIMAEAKKKAAETTDLELKDLREQLAEKEKAAEESKKNELEIRKEKRELEQKKRDMELEFQRRIDEASGKVRLAVATELDEKHRLELADKEKRLVDMAHQLEDMKRRVEQGSQQAQGEVLEQDLEQRLRVKYNSTDDFKPIGQGVRGADLLHIVKTPDTREAGKILWESKRTKKWSDSWIQKIKEDMVLAKADIGVIVTENVPKDFHQFELREGIWISDIPSAMNLSLALRSVLLQVARERAFNSTKENQKDLIFNYLTGQEFRNRVEAILRAFVGLRMSITQQRTAMEKHWSSQEKHIERVVKNLSGMSGDIEGLAGKGLPEIQLLEMPEAEEDVSE